MPADRLISKGQQYDFCVDFLASKGNLLKCTICVEKRNAKSQNWKSPSNMKQHVSTTQHQFALIEARVRAISTDMQPPPPPPCPTPWAEAPTQPSGFTCIPAQLDPPCIPRISSETESEAESEASLVSIYETSAALPPTRVHRHQRGRNTIRTLSAADSIHLEQDPALDEVVTQTDEGLLASIFNEDILRGLDEVPVWEPDNTFEPPPAHLNKTSTPWTDRIQFLTHMLFSSPELRFSRSQQRAILQWAESCGMENVPSLHSLDKCAQVIKECVGSPTRKFTSSCGNVYFMNSVCSALQQDMSNPEVRALMQFYPTDGENGVSEIWDGEKLAQGLNPDQLTPMLAIGTSHYYVNEPCELDNGNLFIPEMFLRRQGEMWARGYDVECCHMDGSIVLSVSQLRVLRPTSLFRRNCIEICGEYMDIFKYDDTSAKYQSFLPHPLRSKAQGRPVYSLPFIVFQDDVSGNRTKQYNKHNVCYMSNAALPRTEFNKTTNIRFVGSSTTCTPLEMMEGLTTMFNETFEDPVLVWDAVAESEALVLAYIVLISADNPMHAEHCSSTGLQSNFPCRVCGYGGMQSARKSDAGFAQVVEPGVIRDPQNTVAAVRSQYDAAFTHMAESYLTNAQRAIGVKDLVAQPTLKWIQSRGKELQDMSRPDGSKLTTNQLEQILRTEMEQQGRKMGINPLLELPGFNVHLDTPIEILHTVLLGAVKYFWRFACKMIDDVSKAEVFRVRFNSLSLSGLEMGTQSMPEYICRYRGSLTGKHFRFVVQLIVFAAYDLISPQVLRVFLSLGRLTVLLWYSSIPNMDDYMTELSDAISDFLHLVAIADPRTLIQKTKLHILTHAPLFARRFGPLLGPDSERYESFNSVFRMCSVLSNRLAPSLDTATKMAEMDAVRHIATGGWWLDSYTGKFCRAGPAILDHFKHHPKDRIILGIRPNNSAIPGSLKVLANPKHFKSKTWADALQVYAPCPSDELETLLLSSAESFVARHGNVVGEGSDIVYHDGEQTHLGRVIRIAVVNGISGTTFLIVNPFGWEQELDHLLHMPSVMRHDIFRVVRGCDVVCHVNLQHRCWVMDCDSTAFRTVRQERMDTTLTRATTNHKDATHYIVNIHSMTNALFIRDLIRSNGVNIPLFFPEGTREQARHEGVRLLQAQNDEKTMKKASAAEKLLASEVPEGPAVTHTRGRGGRLGGRRGRSHAPSASHTPNQGNQVPVPVPAAAIAPLAGTNNNQPNQPYAAETPPFAPMLPEGWVAAWSNQCGRYYFFNRITNVSSWEYPGNS